VGSSRGSGRRGGLCNRCGLGSVQAQGAELTRADLPTRSPRRTSDEDSRRHYPFEAIEGIVVGRPLVVLLRDGTTQRLRGWDFEPFATPGAVQPALERLAELVNSLRCEPSDSPLRQQLGVSRWHDRYIPGMLAATVVAWILHLAT
jgi:hypothetical protein